MSLSGSVKMHTVRLPMLEGFGSNTKEFDILLVLEHPLQPVVYVVGDPIVTSGCYIESVVRWWITMFNQDEGEA